jgi:hypothetical protein
MATGAVIAAGAAAVTNCPGSPRSIAAPVGRSS